jgi:hypothetical protein
MRLFEVMQCGDPYSRAAEVREYATSFDDTSCIYRGDLSGLAGVRETERRLRRTYPGCKVRRS